MIDTDKYGMTNEELLERFSNLLVDDYKDLLAEVKRLCEENEMLLEELKNDHTGTKAIDGLLKAVGDRNEEVKRLRNSEKVLKSILSRYLSTEAIQFHYEKELKEMIE